CRFLCEWPPEFPAPSRYRNRHIRFCHRRRRVRKNGTDVRLSRPLIYGLQKRHAPQAPIYSDQPDSYVTLPCIISFGRTVPVNSFSSFYTNKIAARGQPIDDIRTYEKDRVY